MSPHRLARAHLVTGDDLVVATLLLGVEEIAAHREGRPARSDRPAPDLDRRRLRPVGLDPHAANDAVAPGPAKAWPLGCASPPPPAVAASVVAARLELAGAAGAAAGFGPASASGLGTARQVCRRSRPLAPSTAGAAWGSSSALGQQPFLGSRRPPPVKLRTGAADTSRSDERQTARTRAGWPQPATRAELRLEMTGGHRPCDESEARGTGSAGRRSSSPAQPRDRFVDDGLVANTATIIKTIAPTRSDQGARLKNSHHTTIASAPTTPAKHAVGSPASGATTGAPNHDEQLDDGDDHSRATAGAVFESSRLSLRPLNLMVCRTLTMPRNAHA